MMTGVNSRRSFLKGAGTTLIAAGAASGLALASKPAQAEQHEAVTQTKDTQAATTPEKEGASAGSQETSTLISTLR